MRVFVQLSGLLLLTGCHTSYTSELWSAQRYQHVPHSEERRPVYKAAPEPNVEVFANVQKKDYLVVYDEVYGNSTRTKRRAFYLKENSERMKIGAPPLFVRTSTAKQLERIPLNPPVQTVPSAAFQRNLVIQSAEETIGPCALPIYEKQPGTISKIVKTPAALIGDGIMGALGGLAGR